MELVNYRFSIIDAIIRRHLKCSTMTIEICSIFVQSLFHFISIHFEIEKLFKARLHFYLLLGLNRLLVWHSEFYYDFREVFIFVVRTYFFLIVIIICQWRFPWILAKCHIRGGYCQIWCKSSIFHKFIDFFMLHVILS